MLHFVAPFVAPWIIISYKRARQCSTVAPCTPGGPPIQLLPPGPALRRSSDDGATSYTIAIPLNQRRT